jgi:hypothetical protein
MRAHTEGKDKMGKRFAIVIGVAAAGSMALGAQTATAAPDVVKYDTKLTITHEGHRTNRGVLWHGGVGSEVRKCELTRRVVLFKQRPGADRKLGADRTGGPGSPADRWGLVAPTRGHVYAKVRPEVGDGFVCRADRSRTIENGDLCFEDPSFCRADRSPTIKLSSHPRSLGAQTATSGQTVDSTPPDLQLSGKKKQSQGSDPECTDRCGPWAVKAKASCRDEACTARADGKLTNVKNDKLEPHNSVDLHLAPGETRNIVLELTKSQRKQARKALAEGKNVQAKVTVKATDAAGNVATAKRTIKLIK